jgi:multiple sugar transport system permease protein/putative aldouronate transport system permease protein
MKLQTIFKYRVKTSPEDKVLYTLNYIFLSIIFVIIVYPLVYMISSSFSSGRAVATGRVFFLPVEPTLDGYRVISTYRSIITGYKNSILYTAIGTVYCVLATLMCAYPLSRKNFQGRKFYMTLFVITMFFSGGLIPFYMLVSQLKLVNTMWSIILPSAINTFNMIIARTFFMSTLPSELIEASQIDGCNDFRFFFVILLPLSKAIIAVLALYYAVDFWNSWFYAMIFMRNPDLHPLQLVLRSILVIGNIDTSQIRDPKMIEQLLNMAELLKYSVIVIATVPIAAVYPFVQKYFVKGVMIGSLKG